jgi:hypothetical protein
VRAKAAALWRTFAYKSCSVAALAATASLCALTAFSSSRRVAAAPARAVAASREAAAAAAAAAASRRKVAAPTSSGSTRARYGVPVLAAPVAPPASHTHPRRLLPDSSVVTFTWCAPSASASRARPIHSASLLVCAAARRQPSLRHTPWPSHSSTEKLSPHQRQRSTWGLGGSPNERTQNVSSAAPSARHDMAPATPTHRLTEWMCERTSIAEAAIHK